MTMREQIARAIEKTIDMKANGWSLQKEASYAAAAAVLAELRVPTDAMLRAGFAAARESRLRGYAIDGLRYQAQIDAAGAE